MLPITQPIFHWYMFACLLRSPLHFKVQILGVSVFNRNSNFSKKMFISHVKY
jgi:hypothetical protein